MTQAGSTAPRCERACDVRPVEELLRALVSGLDPDAVQVHEARGLWEAFDRVVRLGESAKTLLARRVEDACSWKREGFRSAAEQLALLSGTSMGSARGQLETSKQLKELPATAQVLRKGSLSGAKAKAIASAASVAPGSEGELLAGAGRASLSDLQKQCLRARAGVDRDAAHARIHKERRLSEWPDGEGAWNLAARGVAEAGAEFRAAHEPLVDAMFKAARAAGNAEPREAYAFDAFMELIRRAAGTAPGINEADTGGTGPGAPKGSKPKPTPVRYMSLVRVDFEALKRGQVEGDEVCEINGLGPIPVGVARRLLGESIVKLVITKGVDVANVTHLGRGPTVAQQVALWWASPCCTVEGCTRTRWLENDHNPEWTETKRTRVDELDPLCTHHHDLKTHDGWALITGTGRRVMVPPDDPRHPNRAGPDSSGQRETADPTASERRRKRGR